MIHFFRRIRQKLFQENKFTKYLFYAIGEITLVMIGILLALQVNNWNQNRLNNRLEVNYLNRLHADIQRDTAMLHDYLRVAANKRTFLKSIADNKLTTLFNDDNDLPYILQSRFDALVQPSNNAYTELTNTGRLGLLKNIAIREGLFDYYQEIRNRNRTLSRSMSDWTRLISQLIPVTDDNSSITNFKGTINISKEKESIIINNIMSQREMLIPHINAETQYSFLQRISFNRIVTIADELLILIQDEIQSK